MPERLHSTLPLADSFEVGYLEFNGILPLEIAGERLRVAVAGEPAVEVLDDLELSFGVPLDLVPVTAEELSEGIRRTFGAAENVVELVRNLAGCDRFSAGHIRLALHGEEAHGERMDEPHSLYELRYVHVRRTVHACAGDTRRAAELLGISRTHVYRLLRDYGTPAPETPEGPATHRSASPDADTPPQAVAPPGSTAFTST